MHPMTMTPSFFDELQIYRTVYSRNNPTSLTPEEAFYQISTPFLMDSQLANWFAQKSETVAADKSAEEKRKRRKRKRKVSEAETFLVEDTQFVMTMHQQFLLSCQDKNSQENIGNKKARDLVGNAPETSLEPSNLGTGQTLSRVEIADACSNQATNSCTRPILYKNERSEFIRVGNFVYPPNCGFLIGDVSLANRLPNQQSGNFDFILMDPPWNNRTVKRQKTYELLRSSRGSTFDQIQHISLPKMLDPNGLLCIWVTNSQVAKKAAAELLEHWQLRRLARWFWLKICKSGEPICPFRPEHKVPFESLIFACHPEAVDKFTDFPENNCLISVPNACPSRKPPISLLLESLGLIQPVRNGLELYGRYLLPNFTTIGFEANKFQHQYYFHENA